MLTKKKLEYIIRQSELYTGFMAHKLGMNVIQEKPKDVLVNGQKVEIDEEEIRQNVEKTI